MEKKYILALDQGTTSSCNPLRQSGPHCENDPERIDANLSKAGWVEHDAMEIWGTQSGVAREVIETAGINTQEIAAIGITNQRETTVVWDKHTGKPVCNAIVWQCRRTAAFCDALKARGLESYVRENTGLVVNAYFSGTKVNWILENVEGAREKAEAGELLFGTIDTWLIWNPDPGQGPCH